MTKPLKYKEMLNKVRSVMEAAPEHREGKNKQYELVDAGMSAFSVFYMQEASFLSWQEEMEKKQGKNNARSLFGIERIPSTVQIRNLLDPIETKVLGGAFWWVYEQLARRGQMERYKGVGGTWLVSLDGTQHHSSSSIHCDECRVVVRQEKAQYEHQVLLAVQCAPGEKEVICLEPEFITPQDGHNKQDCEQAAIKRWLQQHGKRFAPWQVTYLTDDLHSHQPTCEMIIEQQAYFILTCKRESHKALYEELDLLVRVEGAIQEKTVRLWNGHHYERCIYRWALQLPIRQGTDALRVNWCELSVYDERTGAQSYHHTWITNHIVNEHTVAEVCACGRTRWKVENEGINVLKQHGYHFEHNYGHGQQHLASVLLCFLLLAFLVHSVLQLGCDSYRAVRQALRTRAKFFESLRSLTRFFYFRSWEQLLTFMFQGLELNSS